MKGATRNPIRIAAVTTSIIAASTYHSSALASNIQVFTGLDYTNPAEMSFTLKNWEFILGDDWVIPDLQFNGTVNIPDPAHVRNVVASGTSNNEGSYNLPYGRVAKRISDQWTIGLDVTDPYATNVKWPSTSNAALNSQQLFVNSTDIAPNIAYQFSGPLHDLSVGVGMDILYVTATLNQMYPSLPVPPPPTFIPFGAGNNVSITNNASNWATGWHAGLVYHALKGTFVGVSYFSAITPSLNGTSTFSGYSDSSLLSTTANLPATTNVSLTQFFNEHWLIRAQVFYSEWNTFQKLLLVNTAGPNATAVLPLNYHNTWRYDLSTRIDVTPKWTLAGLVAYDETPTNNTDRTLGLPESNLIDVGVSAEYKLTKILSITADYGHTFFTKNAPINNTNVNNGEVTTGSVQGSANVVGLRLTAKA